MKLSSLILIIPFFCFGQSNNEPAKSKLSLQLHAGINLSKFNNDTLTMSYGSGFAGGLNVVPAISNRLNLKAAVSYSYRKSKSLMTGYYKFRNSYVDFALMPQFKFHDLLFEAGANYSALFRARQIGLNGGNKFGLESFPAYGFKSEFDICAGAEFKLQKRVNVEINYYMPLSSTGSQNFRVAFNILLGKQKDKKPSIRKASRLNAEQQIRNLHDGTLLVCLNTFEKKINALKVLGKTKRAEKLLHFQRAENIKVVSAFKNHFTFCPVLFFFSTDIERVLQKDFNGIFLNDSLEYDTLSKLNSNKPVFIARFNPIERDTSKYFSSDSYSLDENGERKKVKTYYGGPNFDFEALVIKDEHFVQLKKPFPYYTRAIFISMRKHPEEVLFISLAYLFSLTWRYDTTVERMNQKLTNYYHSR